MQTHFSYSRFISMALLAILLFAGGCGLSLIAKAATVKNIAYSPSPKLLFASSTQGRVSSHLYSQLQMIFPYVQKSKPFSLIYDHAGHILLATITQNHKAITAIRYTNSHGYTGYYTPNGQTLWSSLFLKTPLKYVRISNGYTTHRWHPILHIVRPHYGIDYAAPTGTPIHAIGSGRISFAGWGGGYGRAVLIRHNNRYQSLYAHMSRIQYLVKPGQWVRQGQVIGYVGSTGLATGPHLHFGLYEYGRPVNPTGVLPKTNPPLAIAQRDLPDFLAKTNQLFTQLALAQNSHNHANG